MLIVMLCLTRDQEYMRTVMTMRIYYDLLFALPEIFCLGPNFVLVDSRSRLSCVWTGDLTRFNMYVTEV